MDILDTIRSQIGADQIQHLSGKLGTDPAATEKAIGVALPLLIAGLAHNANSSPQGAASLASAVDRDHTGDLLSALGGGASGGLGDLLGSVLGASPGRNLDGGGILGHIFGKKRNDVEKGVQKSTGMDAAQVTRLLMLLAPIVMSAVGQMKRRQQLDPGGMAGKLDQQRRSIEKQTTGLGPGGLGGLLDRNRDGSIADDIASIGAGLAKSWLAGRAAR